jgi:mannosyltransferase
MAVSSAALLVWDLSRPALWLDESATVVATQRTWPGLWLLLQGSDAPLVPYYALEKSLAAAVTAHDPSAATHPEILFRWPSVVALVLAVWALSVWLARYWSCALAVTTGTVLLTTVGISRYGQEARPYAFVLLAAIAATVLWSRLLPARRKRSQLLWGLGYAVGIVLLVAANSLAGTLVAAHLVAALATSRKGRRLSPVLRTFGAGAFGLALIAPFALAAARHGLGASRYPALTAGHLLEAFNSLFTPGPHRILGVGVLLPLAVLGLPQTLSTRYRFVARLAVAWALVPLTLLVPAVMLRPNLLIGRYALFVVPGWAILGGLGAITVAQFVRRFLTWPVRGSGTLAAGAGPLAAGLGTIAALAVLTTTTLIQLPGLKEVRGPAGHGAEDLRPALAAANQPDVAGLPIVVSSTLGSLEVAAYDRAAENRVLGIYVQRSLPIIWPQQAPSAVRAYTLRRQPAVVLLMRHASSEPNCPWTEGAAAEYVSQCMPPILRRLGFHVVRVDSRGSGWIFALLDHEVSKNSLKPEKTHN